MPPARLGILPSLFQLWQVRRSRVPSVVGYAGRHVKSEALRRKHHNDAQTLEPRSVNAAVMDDVDCPNIAWHRGCVWHSRSRSLLPVALDSV